jgi:D-alanyl-D-alanine carboxypeptidase
VTADASKITTIAIVKGDVPALPQPPGARPGVLGTLPVTKVASAGDVIPVSAAAPAPAEKAHAGGWMIQVGAFDDEQEAKQRLTNAQIKAKDQLAQAEQFTERVAKGDKSMYRARFAGLDKAQAETACKSLKRSEIPCMLLRN